jgi:hypothetical protein
METVQVFRVFRCDRCGVEFRLANPVQQNENPYAVQIAEHLCAEGKTGIGRQVGLDTEVI